MAVDDPTQAVLGLIRQMLPEIGSVPAPALREALERLRANAPPGPEMDRVDDLQIETAAGLMALRVYRPTDPPRAIVLFLHGGGWTFGSVQSADGMAWHIAANNQAVVVSVDYRLAPEHPFPAAVEDASDALQWVIRNRSDIAATDLPLFLAGDSAGANLCTVAVALAQQEDRDLIAGQILIYPCLEGDIDSPDFEAFESPYLTKRDLAWFFDQYVPDRRDRTDPRFAPTLRQDLRGMPATLILTAENDLLAAQAERYGRRLVEAGAPVTARRFQGAVHGFLGFVGLVQWREAHSEIAAFISSRAVARDTASGAGALAP